MPLDPALAAPSFTPRLPAWAWALALVAGTWVLRVGALEFTDGPGGLAIVWPAAGLLVYALLVTRRRAWPIVLALAVAVGVADGVRVGRPVVRILGMEAAVSLGAVASAWMLTRLSARPTLRTLRGTLAFAVAAAVPAAVAAALARAVLAAAAAPLAAERVWVFWGGTTLGIVLITALLVEWSEPPTFRARGAGGLVSIAGIVVALAGGLALDRLPAFQGTGEVILLPPLIWAALQFGQRGATTALALGAAAFLVFGPWTALPAPGVPDPAFAIQLFFGAGAVSILAVAAVGEERRAAEARRVLLESAMDQSPVPASVIADDGRVIWANEASARVLGVPRASVVGRTVLELGLSPDEWAGLWRRAAAGPAVCRPPERLAAMLDQAEVSAGLVDVDGSRVLVAALHDLSDRHRAEEASRLAALGTLAAGVAHDINNPLSYVVSNLAHLTNYLSAVPDRDGSVRAEVLEPLAEAEDGARRVRDIVRQLGAFARADEASGPVDPGRVLRGALAMAGNEVRHRARIVTDLAATPAVIASEGRLGQVFVALLVNAAQAIPEGRAERHEIRVTLAARGDDVVVEIADTGQGMSVATRSRIFEPFFTTRAPGSGSGLGLAIAHSVVTRLGGRIDVESTQGQGSLFRVTLPAARGVTVPSARRAQAHPPTPPPPTARSRGAEAPSPPLVAAGRLRVLVVDDEPLVSKALARLLAGHDVVTSNDGREALARVSAGERFDAVVCDLMMPELSGMELYGAVSAVAPELARRFIFITGGAFTDSARDFVARARSPFLEKPVDRSTLQAAVRDVARA
jgi:PAS domain S-box-containing protein